MKIILLFRQGLGSLYLAHQIANHFPLTGIILETGKKAKKMKLKKLLQTKPIQSGCDILSLSLLNTLTNRHIKRFIHQQKIKNYPKAGFFQKANDANQNSVQEKLQESQPDVIVVHGTSILKPPIIKTAKKYILNIHGGIVPQYRNVHSSFWAYLNQDFQHLGASVQYLNEGIDSGEIAAQDTITDAQSLSFSQVKLQNLQLKAKLILKVLHQIKNRKNQKNKQVGKVGWYQTPTFKDIIKLLKTNKPFSSFF